MNHFLFEEAFRNSNGQTMIQGSRNAVAILRREDNHTISMHSCSRNLEFIFIYRCLMMPSIAQQAILDIVKQDPQGHPIPTWIAPITCSFMLSLRP